MSIHKINLLNSYTKLDELNELQIINRRNMLKEITTLMQNNYLIIKLSEKDNLNNLIDHKYVSSLGRYNLTESLPVINWSHTVLRGSENMKSGYEIQGSFINSPYFFLINSNGNEVVFYLLRRMLNTTNYENSNLLKPKYVDEICKTFKLGTFKNHNFRDIRSFVLYEYNLEADFFDNLLNLFSESLIIYLNKYKKIENQIINLYEEDIEIKKQNKYEKFGIFKFLKEFGYIFNREEKAEMISKANRILEISEQALEEKEHYILKKRYFNNNVEIFCELVNLQKIGDEYSLTRERVRQIERKAFVKLKSLIKTIDLEKNFNEDLSIFCKSVMPSYKSRRGELKETISFLEEKYDIYFRGQLKIFGKDNLSNLLEDLNVSELASKKFIRDVFGDTAINNDDSFETSSITYQSFVDDVNFSARIVNALNAVKIFTIEDLLKLKQDELGYIPNLGVTSIEEIILKIKNLNFKFKS